jgi:hypothetical protein
MARIKLGLVFRDFSDEIELAGNLASMATAWNRAGRIEGLPRFTNRYCEMITGLAFLQAFLAWEKFLEESYILYLLGKASPSGFTVRCYVSPHCRDHAINFTKAGNRYSDWTTISQVVDHADLHFKDGRPYTDALRPKVNLFNEMKIIRNAIAHNSDESREKFMSMVRGRLGHFPIGLNPGKYLSTVITGSVPSSTYLSFYLNELILSARIIIPS